MAGCADRQPSKSCDNDFQWQIDRFADVNILRYQIPHWEQLSLRQKELLYYLGEAAIWGRDIIYDQNYRHNLAIRRVLESIYRGYEGDRTSPDWAHFEVYLKRVWFSNGIHHLYSTDKFFPDFSAEYFAALIEGTPLELFPSDIPATEGLFEYLSPLIFSNDVALKRVNQAEGVDMVANSANNFYRNLTQAEVQQFYAELRIPDDPTPISYGLNSQLVKENGEIFERVWSKEGMYGSAIERVVFWLEKAASVAENPHQQKVINTLIEHYRSGDLKLFDEYSILWLGVLHSQVDFVNGFIETYGDPLGYKASWESVVNFKDEEATLRTEVIGANAQWFEDHSPIDSQFKKSEVKGVTAKVINVTTLGGDCYPATPIGINLPNADWIRKEYGSKSVTIENIIYAYDRASIGNGFIEEFAWSDEEVERAREHGFLARVLHTDLHECLGHGSGQLAPGIRGDELKNYGAALEEARADLFALYFMMDTKMIELGVMTSLEVAHAAYDSYIRNGMLTQLTRIELGNNLEQAHMRNRQLVAKWCYHHGKESNVIERRVRDGRTYFVVNDYQALRELFAMLLKEVQRIKSTGDFEAGRDLVETYGVMIERDLHAEVLERFAKLGIAPYSGFVNPRLIPVYKQGQIIDVKVEYVEGYIEQMMRYSNDYSSLPTYN